MAFMTRLIFMLVVICLNFALKSCLFDRSLCECKSSWHFVTKLKVSSDYSVASVNINYNEVLVFSF